MWSAIDPEIKDVEAIIMTGYVVCLSRLDAARVPQDMNLPGWKFHQLHGDLDGHYGVTVNKNWRLTFAFSNGHAILVDYQDYH